jgi:transmembrane sensor
MNASPEQLLSTMDAQRMSAAWQWVFAISREPVNPEDLAAWLDWYESDEKNRLVYDEALAFWSQAGNANLASATHAPPLVNRRRRARVLLAAACAAGLCAALILAGLERGASQSSLAQGGVSSALSADPSAPVTATTLPDGSKVELAAKTAVSLQYTERKRMLVLQSGVAYFSVAHNRERPFVVRVGDLCVRAIGTAFNVRKAAGRVVVTVAEGTVDVYPAAKEAAAPAGGLDVVGAIQINAGKEITWGEQSAGPTIATVDTQHALAWRDGRLDYLDEPLAAAVADINRYSQRKVIIRDAAVGRIMFNGTVRTDATEDWVNALPKVFPVRVYIDADGNLVLAARDRS